MDINKDKTWDDLLIKLQKRFGSDINLKGVLYLIGVQELNKGLKKFSKEDKVSIFHLAICKLLSNYGYYVFDYVDEDGWPHWKETKALKSLTEKQQETLMKKAIIEYLN